MRIIQLVLVVGRVHVGGQDIVSSMRSLVWSERFVTGIFHEVVVIG